MDRAWGCRKVEWTMVWVMAMANGNGKWQMADGKLGNHANHEKNPVMAKYKHFEDLPVWQEAKRLYNAVLDLLEEPNPPCTSAFRSQLDRAALSVSNHVAKGFERSTTQELRSFIAISRGSAGEVRSMIAVVKDRLRLQCHLAALKNIRALAESCARQLTGWESSLGKLPFDGRRHLPEKDRVACEAAQKSREFRLNFLRNLIPNHPLFNSTEAREARGEVAE